MQLTVCDTSCRMTLLPGATFLFLATLCVSSEQEKVTLEVLYSKESISPPRGSSVKLSCNVHYDFAQCGLLHAVWCHHTKQSAELTDHRKYITTVNETAVDDTVRRRQVVTEILDVTPEDDGLFQCKAECQSGDTAMGHFISIAVTG